MFNEHRCASVTKCELASSISHHDKPFMHLKSRLKVAFFGSDAFSVHALDRLMRLSHPQISVDVFTRSIKPTGRKLKTLVDLPVGVYAQKQNLNVFRVDTATEILDTALPRGYDLAIAVSFGKLIPGQFLQALPHGGLNVHPSVLPKFSGSSPLQYALMHDCKTTGVTVQTLHPTKFDCGDLIAQTTNVPIHDDDNFASLQDKLGVLGADLMEKVLRDELYVNPVPLAAQETYSLAPKLRRSQQRIDWDTCTAREAKRLCDALGTLHTNKEVEFKRKKQIVHETRQVILHDVKEISKTPHFDRLMSVPGDFALYDNNLVVKTSDGFISVGSVKLQYCGLESGDTFMANLRKRCGGTKNAFFSKPTLQE